MTIAPADLAVGNSASSDEATASALPKPGTASAPVLLPTPTVRRRGRQGGYLAKKCFTGAAKDNMPNTYPPELKRPYSAFTRELMDKGNAFEGKIGQRLLDEADPRRVVVIGDEERDPVTGDRTPESKLRKEEATWAAYLDPNVWFVFNARIGGRFEELLSQHLGRQVTDSDRISEPDGIAFGEVMPNGLRAMYFVDVKDHKTTSGKSKNDTRYPASPISEPFYPAGDEVRLSGQLNIDDWYQLAHYHRHGQTLGVVADGEVWGAVIGRDEVLVWARVDANRFLKFDEVQGKKRRMSALELYDRDFARGLAVIDNAILRDDDPSVPPLALPEWKDECKECPWKDVCHEELVEFPGGGHITLLPGITPDKARAHYAAGVESIRDLAALDTRTATAVDAGYDVTGVEGMCQTTAAYVGTGVTDLLGAIDQARVTRSGKVHRARDAQWVDLDRAAIEIDIDLENDERLYMFGCRATGRRRRPDGTERQRVEMHTFADYSNTDEGEMRVFVETWDYLQYMLQKARMQKHSIRIYHYSAHERTWFRKLAEKYAGQPGVPTVRDVELFLDSGVVIDMYQALSKQLLWPTENLSIKSLAKHCRHVWRDETPGGDMSMVWYRAAVAAPDPTVREENQKRLTQYNEDDVEAQLRIRDWISSLGEARRPGLKLPSVEDLRPPLPQLVRR